MYKEAINSEKASRTGVSERSKVWCLVVAAAVFLLSFVLVVYSARLLLAVTFLICVMTTIVLVWRRSINILFALSIVFFGPTTIVLACDRLLPISRPIYCLFVHETPAEFRDWFSKHSLEVQRDSFRCDDDLSKHIRRVDPRLHYELGNVEADGCQTLTISPGEDLEALPIAERVVSEAPHLKSWHVVACRQRRPLETELGGYPTMEWLETHYEGGGCYKMQDVLFDLKDGGCRANIELYLKRDKIGLGDNLCHQLAEKVIEDSMGERDYMLLVDKIDVFSGDLKIPSSARPIAELPTAFDHWAGNTKRDIRYVDEGFCAPKILSHRARR